MGTLWQTKHVNPLSDLSKPQLWNWKQSFQWLLRVAAQCYCPVDLGVIIEQHPMWHLSPCWFTFKYGKVFRPDFGAHRGLARVCSWFALEHLELQKEAEIHEVDPFIFCTNLWHARYPGSKKDLIISSLATLLVLNRNRFLHQDPCGFGSQNRRPQSPFKVLSLRPLLVNFTSPGLRFHALQTRVFFSLALSDSCTAVLARPRPFLARSSPVPRPASPGARPALAWPSFQAI